MKIRLEKRNPHLALIIIICMHIYMKNEIEIESMNIDVNEMNVRSYCNYLAITKVKIANKL